jgi:ion channel
MPNLACLAAALVSMLLIVLMLIDSFETVMLPRRVTHPYRLARMYYRAAWRIWRSLSALIVSPRRRQTFFSVFGPSSILTLFGIWVAGLIAGFAMLGWSLDVVLTSPEGRSPTLFTYFYLSGVTFFTLGFGDVTPLETGGRLISAIEAGIGFGFLALIISYLPVLYQAFSRRELMISLMDARMGSPPSAGKFLSRVAQSRQWQAVDPFLAELERWSAELLESHLSFPVLTFYRSQHDNQSWLATLTAILDTCALLIAGTQEAGLYQAQLTFAMARHAAVDLALVLQTPPIFGDSGRFSLDRWRQLKVELEASGMPVREGPAAEQKFAELRGMYEPFVAALSLWFRYDLPEVFPERTSVDNWQTSAWMRRTAGIGELAALDAADDHFD